MKTGVTIEGQEYIEYLPIMDFHNASIPIERLSSTDVNKGIQRGLTKAIARHGLGFYIYAGEDLPEAEVEAANAAEIEKAEQEAKDQNLVNQYIQTLDKALSDFDQSSVQQVFSEIADNGNKLKSKVYKGVRDDVKEFIDEVMVSSEAA